MKKKTISIITIIMLLILLIPIQTRYKDGGSVRYRAILYDIMKYHQLDEKSETGYKDGWTIKFLGFSVYDDFN